MFSHKGLFTFRWQYLCSKDQQSAPYPKMSWPFLKGQSFKDIWISDCWIKTQTEKGRTNDLGNSTPEIIAGEMYINVPTLSSSER